MTVSTVHLSSLHCDEEKAFMTGTASLVSTRSPPFKRYLGSSWGNALGQNTLLCFQLSRDDFTNVTTLDLKITIRNDYTRDRQSRRLPDPTRSRPTLRQGRLRKFLLSLHFSNVFGLF
jgi:hypothetical protein